MKIRREADLGLQAMLGLARGGQQRSAQLLPAASPQERSETLTRLAEAGLVRRLAGRTYALDRPAARITVLEIIEASQGRLKLQWTWSESWLDNIYEQAAEALRKRLGKVRLATISQEGATPTVTSSGG